jgi:hypothetical protein
MVVMLKMLMSSLFLVDSWLKWTVADGEFTFALFLLYYIAPD